MSWSKVKKGKKPLIWWYHKFICEFGYHINNMRIYYNHLNIMCKKCNINLYGDKC